ncbi:MAG: hypothetical protein AAGA30_03510 [Planctomycetota bacterium]
MKISTSNFTTLAFLLGSFSFFGESLSAQQSFWTGNGSNQHFSNSSNWDAGVPDPNTRASFHLNSTFSVNLTTSVNARSIDARNVNCTFFGGNKITIGTDGDASFIWSDAQLKLNGPDTIMNSDGILFVGGTIGPGLLTIENNAEFNQSNAASISIIEASSLIIKGDGKIFLI